MTEEKPIPKKSDDRNKIFIGGVPRETSEEQFTAIFAKFGELTDSVIIKDRDGQPRGFGFVSYKEATSVDAVLAESLELNGRKLDCKPATPRPGEGGPRPPRRRGGGRDRERDRGYGRERRERRGARFDPRERDYGRDRPPRYRDDYYRDDHYRDEYYRDEYYGEYDRYRSPPPPPPPRGAYEEKRTTGFSSHPQSTAYPSTTGYSSYPQSSTYTTSGYSSYPQASTYGSSYTTTPAPRAFDDKRNGGYAPYTYDSSYGTSYPSTSASYPTATYSGRPALPVGTR